jgi:hypothetical protein
MVLQMFYNMFIAIGVTWLITMGERGKIDHGFRSQGVKESRWKEGKTGLNQSLIHIHPFLPLST